MDAARTLLKTRPMQDICMDEVAKAAGVGKGTLYRRFADRAALCHALLNDEAIVLQNRVLNGFGRPIGPPWTDRIQEFLDAQFDFVVDNASLLSEARAFERGGVARFQHPAHTWQRDTLIRYLERAMEAAEIRPVDPWITAELLLAPLDPDLLTHALAHGAPRDRLQSELQRQWRYGLPPSLATPPA